MQKHNQYVASQYMYKQSKVNRLAEYTPSLWERVINFLFRGMGWQ